MRKYAFRKMTQDDFHARLQRLEPGAHRVVHAGETQRRHVAPGARGSRHPLLSTLMGFGWAYLAVAVARHREQIETSLLQGSLPERFHVYILGALAAALAISGVMVLVHVLRWLRHRGAARGNSGALLLGILVALALVYTPPSLFESAFGMLDDNTRALLLTTSGGVQDRLSSVDLGGAVFVSSLGF